MGHVTCVPWSMRDRSSALPDEHLSALATHHTRSRTTASQAQGEQAPGEGPAESRRGEVPLLSKITWMADEGLRRGATALGTARCPASEMDKRETTTSSHLAAMLALNTQPPAPSCRLHGTLSTIVASQRRRLSDSTVLPRAQGLRWGSEPCATRCRSCLTLSSLAAASPESTPLLRHWASLSSGIRKEPAPND